MSVWLVGRSPQSRPSTANVCLHSKAIRNMNIQKVLDGKGAYVRIELEYKRHVYNDGNMNIKRTGSTRLAGDEWKLNASWSIFILWLLVLLEISSGCKVLRGRTQRQVIIVHIVVVSLSQGFFPEESLYSRLCRFVWYSLVQAAVQPSLNSLGQRPRHWTTSTCTLMTKWAHINSTTSFRWLIVFLFAEE